MKRKTNSKAILCLTMIVLLLFSYAALPALAKSTSKKEEKSASSTLTINKKKCKVTLQSVSDKTKGEVKLTFALQLPKSGEFTDKKGNSWIGAGIVQGGEMNRKPKTELRSMHYDSKGMMSMDTGDYMFTFKSTEMPKYVFAYTGSNEKDVVYFDTGTKKAVSAETVKKAMAQTDKKTAD